MEEKKLTLEVLISAMHQKDFSIVERTGIKGDVLIINQCDENSYAEKQTENGLWRMISTTERGLAKSRNLAIKNAVGDIALLCDDDEDLEENYEEIILNAYKELPDASSIIFNVNRINYKMKKTYYKITKIKKAPKYRGYGAVMTTFCVNDIREKNIIFPEKFGSGTEWGGGDEILFQDDIRSNKLKMYEYPKTIATIDYSGGSSWFHGYTKQYFYNLGAFNEYKYKRNFVMKWLRMIYTCYKLRREKDLSPFQKIKWMRLGMKGIKNNVTYKEYVKKYGE